MTSVNPEETAGYTEKFAPVVGINLILYAIPYIIFFSKANIRTMSDHSFSKSYFTLK